MRQWKLFADKTSVSYGGTASIGKRKSRRPLDPSKALHVVMRSNNAKGGRSLRRHQAFVKGQLQKLAMRWQIRVYRFSNNGNHLHLLVRGRHRDDIISFLRTFSATIAMR